MSEVLVRRYAFFDGHACNMCGAAANKQVLWGRRLDRPQGFWPRRLHGITVSIVRCNVCRLVYPNPMPVPEDLADHYDVPPDEYWSADAMPAQAHAGYADTFEQLTGRKARGSRVLDIGAGLGAGMLSLDRTGFSTYGIEPSPSFRRAALDRTGIAPERLQLASVEGAQFEPATFDLVLFSAVLEHLRDPAAALEKAMSWLVPGGVAYVEVPSSAWLMSRLLRAFYRLTGNDFVINTSPMHVPYHLFEFGLASFQLHGERAGYVVARHEFFPCEVYAPRIMARPLSGFMARSDTGMQLGVWLRRTAP